MARRTYDNRVGRRDSIHKRKPDLVKIRSNPAEQNVTLEEHELGAVDARGRRPIDERDGPPWNVLEPDVGCIRRQSHGIYDFSDIFAEICKWLSFPASGHTIDGTNALVSWKPEADEPLPVEQLRRLFE